VFTKYEAKESNEMS